MGISEPMQDVLLMAYVDDELDEDQRVIVEELLARDPEARQWIAQLQELSLLLKAAYNEHL
jgi:anti-sigma factor RsiW